MTLCDGFGFKNVVKVLRMAQLMPGAFPAATLDMLLDCALRTFGDAFMQPRIGLLLDADASLTYEWRISQERRLGPAEDLSLAGRPGRESYLEFQAGLAKEYRAAAEAWGWTCCPWTAGRRRRPSRRRSTSCSPPFRPTVTATPAPQRPAEPGP